MTRLVRSRGQGSFGFGGPLPSTWMASQHALQVKIMTRLRELQMFGILPGFQGNVPMEFPQIFPHSNSSGGWLDALDPLFGKIAEDFNARAQADFGPASFVEADGWFSLETGPWLTAFDKGGESSTSSVPAADGDCLGGFVVPTEQEAAARVAAVYASLTTAAADAVWVYQGTSAPSGSPAPASYCKIVPCVCV